MPFADSAATPGSDFRVRIGLVDDHLVVRVGLRALLEASPGLEVVGEAANGGEALDLVKRLAPDVVLLDLRLPDLDGLEVCRRIKTGPTPPAVLFLTSYGDDQAVLSAVEAGADGYLLKSAAGEDLANAVLTVARGGSVLDPLVTRTVLQKIQRPSPRGTGPRKLVENLTAQESRALALVARGLSNKQIAHQLALSEGTVRNYLSTAFAKLGVVNRVEAATFWLKSGNGFA